MRTLVAVALSAVLVAEPALAGSHKASAPRGDSDTTVYLVTHTAAASEQAAPPPALLPVTPGAMAQARRVVNLGLHVSDAVAMLSRAFDGNAGDMPENARAGMRSNIGRMGKVMAAHEGEIDEALARALAESYDETTLAQLGDFLEAPEGRALIRKMPDLFVLLIQQAPGFMPARAGGPGRPVPEIRADPANVRLAHSVVLATMGHPKFTWTANGKTVTYAYPVTQAQMARLDKNGRRLARDFNDMTPRTMAIFEKLLAATYTPQELMGFLAFSQSQTVKDLGAGMPRLKYAMATELTPIMQKIGPEMQQAMQAPDGPP